MLLALALLAAGCTKGTSADKFDPPKDVTQTTIVEVGAADKAKEIFAQRCTPCHGASGRGDGAASASLNPHPRNFHDPEWQKSVQDDYLIQIIKMGGGAVGKSPAMPGNPDLKDDAVLAGLKDYIRELGNQP